MNAAQLLGYFGCFLWLAYALLGDALWLRTFLRVGRRKMAARQVLAMGWHLAVAGLAAWLWGLCCAAMEGS